MILPRPRWLAAGLATIACAAMLAACSSDPAPEREIPHDPEVAVGDIPGPDVDGFPTMESTGPLVPEAVLQHSESVSSEEDGEVIENLEVDGRVRITHNNVTVRNLRINHIATKPGQYGLLIDENQDGECPNGVVIENIEIVGDPAVLVDNAKAVYGPCPFTLENSRIIGVGTGIRLVSNSIVRGNFIRADFSTDGSDTHRSAIGINGGSGDIIEGNTVICDGPGCSGALVMYGDFQQIRDILVTGNIFNTTGSYCTYAGSLDSKRFPIANDVRYIDNTFGQEFFDTCGRYGPVAGRDSGGGPGFVWEGNVWEGTGDNVPIS